MGLISLLTGQRRASIGHIELDASIEELHSVKSQVTRHPVEAGSQIADHIQLEPVSIRITGQISNHPLEKLGATQAVTDPKRADTAYGNLLWLWANKELVTVVTTLNTYEDMVIESLDVPRNAKLGETVRFTAALTHLQTVESGAVESPTPAVDRANGKRSRGKKPAKPASDAQGERVTSVANKLFG